MDLNRDRSYLVAHSITLSGDGLLVSLSLVGPLLFVRIIKVHVSKYEGENTKRTMGS